MDHDDYVLRARADVFLSRISDRDAAFLFGWKSSQKPTKCLEYVIPCRSLGEQVGNRAIFLKNASLAMRWEIRHFGSHLQLNKSFYVTVGEYV
jgi:hypothetical protein